MVLLKVTLSVSDRDYRSPDHGTTTLSQSVTHTLLGSGLDVDMASRGRSIDGCQKAWGGASLHDSIDVVSHRTCFCRKEIANE